MFDFIRDVVLKDEIVLDRYKQFVAAFFIFLSKQNDVNDSILSMLEEKEVLALFSMVEAFRLKNFSTLAFGLRFMKMTEVTETRANDVLHGLMRANLVKISVGNIHLMDFTPRMLTLTPSPSTNAILPMTFILGSNKVSYGNIMTNSLEEISEFLFQYRDVFYQDVGIYFAQWMSMLKDLSIERFNTQLQYPARNVIDLENNSSNIGQFEKSDIVWMSYSNFKFLKPIIFRDGLSEYTVNSDKVRYSSVVMSDDYIFNTMYTYIEISPCSWWAVRKDVISKDTVGEIFNGPTINKNPGSIPEDKSILILSSTNNKILKAIHTNGEPVNLVPKDLLLSPKIWSFNVIHLGQPGKPFIGYWFPISTKRFVSSMFLCPFGISKIDIEGRILGKANSPITKLFKLLESSNGRVELQEAIKHTGMTGGEIEILAMYFDFYKFKAGDKFVQSWY